ncbi:MAG TPA: hypothetical protein VGN31_08740 [Paraburkholderia sp.]
MADILLRLAIGSNLHARLLSAHIATPWTSAAQSMSSWSLTWQSIGAPYPQCGSFVFGIPSCNRFACEHNNLDFPHHGHAAKRVKRIKPMQHGLRFEYKQDYTQFLFIAVCDRKLSH